MGCFADVPRADVIVAISGCYYEFEGKKFEFDTSNFGNKNAEHLIAGEDDDLRLGRRRRRRRRKVAGLPGRRGDAARRQPTRADLPQRCQRYGVVVPDSPAGRDRARDPRRDRCTGHAELALGDSDPELATNAECTFPP